MRYLIQRYKEYREMRKAVSAFLFLHEFSKDQHEISLAAERSLVLSRQYKAKYKAIPFFGISLALIVLIMISIFVGAISVDSKHKRLCKEKGGSYIQGVCFKPQFIIPID